MSNTVWEYIKMNQLLDSEKNENNIETTTECKKEENGIETAAKGRKGENINTDIMAECKKQSETKCEIVPQTKRLKIDTSSPVFIVSSTPGILHNVLSYLTQAERANSDFVSVVWNKQNRNDTKFWQSMLCDPTDVNYPEPASGQELSQGLGNRQYLIRHGTDGKISLVRDSLWFCRDEYSYDLSKITNPKPYDLFYDIRKRRRDRLFSDPPFHRHASVLFTCECLYSWQLADVPTSRKITTCFCQMVNDEVKKNDSAVFQDMAWYTTTHMLKRIQDLAVIGFETPETILSVLPRLIQEMMWAEDYCYFYYRLGWHQGEQTDEKDDKYRTIQEDKDYTTPRSTRNDILRAACPALLRLVPYDPKQDGIKSKDDRLALQLPKIKKCFDSPLATEPILWDGLDQKIWDIPSIITLLFHPTIITFAQNLLPRRRKFSNLLHFAAVDSFYTLEQIAAWPLELMNLCVDPEFIKNDKKRTPALTPFCKFACDQDLNQVSFHQAHVWTLYQALGRSDPKYKDFVINDNKTYEQWLAFLELCKKKPRILDLFSPNDVIHADENRIDALVQHHKLIQEGIEAQLLSPWHVQHLPLECFDVFHSLIVKANASAREMVQIIHMYCQPHTDGETMVYLLGNVIFTLWSILMGQRPFLFSPFLFTDTSVFLRYPMPVKM